MTKTKQTAKAEIRLAGPSDNLALRVLQETVPVVTPGLVYRLERQPDFFRFHHLQGTGGQVLVAAPAEGPQTQMVGMMNVIYDRVFWDGQSREIAYTGELRLSPAARGQGLADALMREAIGQARRDLGSEVPVFTTVSSANPIGLKKNQNLGRDGVIEMLDLGRIQTQFFPCFLPAWPWAQRPLKGGLKVRRARAQDAAAMWTLWQQTARQRQLARDYRREEWFQAGGRFPLPQAEKWLLLEAGSQLVGMVGLWDQRDLRQVIVTQGPATMRLLLRYQAGQALPVIHALHLCLKPQYYPWFPALFRVMIREACQVGGGLLGLALDAGDPLKHWLAASGQMGQAGEMHLLGSLRPQKHYPYQVEMSLG